MFEETCRIVRESIYGVLCHSDLPDIRTADVDSGFMIAPGIIATVAHALHRNGDTSNPMHQTFEVIRAPDIGNDMSFAHLIVEDLDRDLALLRVDSPHDNRSLGLVDGYVPKGSMCGFLGFPLSSVDFTDDGLHVTMIERFQGAFISALITETMHGRDLDWYETDQLMYSGSSGCPGFTRDGLVFGMQSNTLTSGGPDDEESDRLAIARQVPSTDILVLARDNGVPV